jgi:hypothetical protein
MLKAILKEFENKHSLHVWYEKERDNVDYVDEDVELNLGETVWFNHELILPTFFSLDIITMVS